jgi:superfamily II DNA/RNA helicase
MNNSFEASTDKNSTSTMALATDDLLVDQVKTADLEKFETSEPLENIDDFEHFNLKPELLQGIYAYGFQHPSYIQRKAIKPILDRRDIVLQSHSGTGKTATFGISSIELVDIMIPQPQIIIVTHTRELAVQTRAVLMELGKYVRKFFVANKEISPNDVSKFRDQGLIVDEYGLRIELCIGQGNDANSGPNGGNNGSYNNGSNGQGQRKERDMKLFFAELREESARIGSAQIIVATVGKLHTMITKKRIHLERVKLLVIDEADKILTDNNKIVTHMNEIISEIPSSTKCKMCLVSATFPDSLLDITKTFMTDPVKILLKKENLTLDGICQFFVNVDEEKYKYETIKDLYTALHIKQAIIFVNTKQRAEDLAKQMIYDNHMVSLIHGDMTNDDRRTIIDQFRQGTNRVLVATDLLARGIDVQQVNLVINYDFPTESNLDTYIHRIGRGGRYGRNGFSISFVTNQDAHLIGKVEKIYRTSIKPVPEDLRLLGV